MRDGKTPMSYSTEGVPASNAVDVASATVHVNATFFAEDLCSIPKTRAQCRDSPGWCSTSPQ